MGQLWYEADPAALEQLRALLRRSYPTLHARMMGDKVSVEGTFALIDQDAADRYCIRAELPDDYPRSIPNVWETAGRIERVVDRHVFPRTGALCVGVPIELWLRLAGDFNITTYLEKAVRPYLIGNSLVEEGEPWPFDESAHGSLGVLEFFQRFLGTSDARALGNLLIAIIENRVRGHWACPCRSGKPIRKCHEAAVRALRAVPTHLLSSSAEHMVLLLQPEVAAFKQDAQRHSVSA